MAETTVAPRPEVPEPSRPGDTTTLGRVLGHPLAYLATAAILLLLFGWTFFTNPDQVAPTKDPAYYTWRTEVLISEEPARLIEIEGPENLFAAGYRVTVPVIGGFLRQVADVSTLKTTVFLMVGLPVLTALLLAGFAYRQRRDPLIFHIVAFGSASLLLTEPFVGYLDNLLTLFFLAAALHFLGPARTSWPGRVGFATFVLLAGLTHPTTLVIFGLVLGTISAARVVLRKDLRSVVAEDGPMLLSALAGAVVTYAIWTIGIWGQSASLGEAALPPPYESDFFVDRLVAWVESMLPVLNGPLLAIGAVGLLAAGKRAADDDLASVSIVWLAPLVGLFGFLIGKTYPYYRFFNATLAWVLVAAVGMYFVARFFIDRWGATRPWLGALGIVIVAAVVAANFAKGFDVKHWNDAQRGWLSATEKRDLDALRAFLDDQDEDRPVVFVIDSADESPRVYGDTKLYGNTSRYGLPPGQIDQGYIYLGSLENYVQDQPTLRDLETYDLLSRASLEDAQEGIAASGKDPIVVVASIFNATGANAGPPGETGDADVLFVDDGSVSGSPGPADQGDDAGFTHALWVVVALLLMLGPGLLALRWFVPDASMADAVGLAPALSVAFLALAGILVLAVARSPFSDGLGWTSLVVAAVAAGALLWRARPRPVAGS
ncbi:MAG: hypothetical protein ACRDJI_05155 [Actinomycetota bacterium]